MSYFRIRSVQNVFKISKTESNSPRIGLGVGDDAAHVVSAIAAGEKAPVLGD